MRVVAGFAAFVLLSGIPAVAQDSPQSTTVPDAMNSVCVTRPVPEKDQKDGKTPTITECKTIVVQGCPVDMRVRQRMGGATMAVDANGVKRKVFAQKLRLLLNDLRREVAGEKIVSATVTVHGTGLAARMKPLGSGADNSMARTFTVDLVQWGEPGVSGDFLLPGFTSASRVDLESVTYADGSTWRLSNNETCRAAVDPMMLINP